MVWEINSRFRTGYVFRDPELPGRKRIVSAIRARNYSSSNDSRYDQPVSMQDVAISNGREITNAQHRFAIDRDGWITWGGRRGERELRYRVSGFGWIRWSTRELTQLGGAPTYSAVNTTIDYINDQLTIYNISNVWTVGAGIVDIQVLAFSDKTSVRVRLNSAARTLVAAQYPVGSPTDDTYLAVFTELDVSDIPRWYLNNQLQDPANDIIKLPGDRLVLATSDDSPLGEFGLQQINVDASPTAAEPIEQYQQNMISRFYRDGSGTNWHVAGIRADNAMQLAAGPLILDPDITAESVAQDGYMRTDTGGWIANGFENRDYCGISTARAWHIGWRFDASALAVTDTVNAAAVTVPFGSDNTLGPGVPYAIRVQQNTAASTITDTGGGNAPSQWTVGDEESTGTVSSATGNFVTEDFAAAIQELLDEVGDVTGDINIGCFATGVPADADYFSVFDDTNAGADAVLDIDVTEGGGGTTMPIFWNYYRNMRTR